MLKIVAVHLQQIGLRYGIIDGTVNPKQRMDLVEEFNTNPKGPQVNLTQQSPNTWRENVRTQLVVVWGSFLYLRNV